MSDWKEFLKGYYFNPSNPGAFAGPTKIRKILKENRFNTKLTEVQQWLQDQDAYSLLKPTKYKFKRNRIVTTGLDDLWDVDLAEVGNLHKHNEPYKYWLVVIDVFSRYLWVIPVESKHHTHMVKAFTTLFEKTQRRPKKLRTDKGTEFTNRAVKKLLKEQGINAYTTKNETKANYAERVIRTVKGLLYRYFLYRQTYHYIDVLEKIVENYNNRPHSSLNGLAPAKITASNESSVWKRMYVDTSKSIKKSTFKYKVGDKVRISHLKYTFQRDYQEKWTEEVFIITKRFLRRGHKFYQLKDYTEEDIDGYFYEVELQKVTKDIDSVFRIEKIVKQRGRRGREEYLVKWMGWPSKFNSWVKKNDIQMI